MNDGGDRRTIAAKVDIAQREQQIVALKLRGVPDTRLARVLGITRQGVNKAFKKALHRETSRDINAHHRAELAELEMEKANLWRIMDANKSVWQVQMSGTAQLRGIHIRRAHLLGLDAPAKFDVRGLYGAGEDEHAAERRETERIWHAMSREDIEDIYDRFDATRARLNAPIETTATVTSGSDNRDLDAESADDGDTET